MRYFRFQCVRDGSGRKGIGWKKFQLKLRFDRALILIFIIFGIFFFFKGGSLPIKKIDVKVPDLFKENVETNLALGFDSNIFTYCNNLDLLLKRTVSYFN